MTVAIVRFGGSNCDRDALAALQHLGIDAEIVWHEDGLPGNVSGVVFPGGFSYGDYLRAGAMAAQSPIVAEVREGSLTPDQRAALRELFDGGDVDAPLEARVAHLQNQLADLQAYTDALEAFLAEQGSGEDAIGRLADLEASVNSLEASVADHGERLDALAQNLESVHAAVEDVESDIEDMSHTWEQLRRLFRSEDAITQ